VNQAETKRGATTSNCVQPWSARRGHGLSSSGFRRMILTMFQPMARMAKSKKKKAKAKSQ
jgi:hypothetical protein